MKYTVVAYFEDNNQPLVGWVEADSPEKAVLRFKEQREANPEFVDTSFVVVEVFEGHHGGKLENETTVDSKDFVG